MLSDISIGRHLPAVGVGIVIGAGTALIVDRWLVFSEIRRLRAAVEYLRQEWLQMKLKLDSSSTRRRSNSYSAYSRSSTAGSEYHSVNPSSGDEEEEFEEALEWYTTPPDSLLYKDAQEDFEKIEDETLKNVFTEVEVLYKGNDEEKIKALEILNEHYPQYSKNVEFLWRLARQCMLVSDIEGAKGNTEKRKELLHAGKDYAYTGLTIDDESSDAHKWYALCLGSVGEYEPTQQKIKNGFIFKDHIEKAIRLKPNEAALRHFLGRWCYEVAQLSWLERKAAAALYATPPTATVDQALDYFLQAEELEPGFWKTNSLYLAKCYIQKASYVYARMWLEKCLLMPSESPEERQAHTEAEELMEKYRDYY
ncbi:regulator of microtubule dynamics protein 1-like [Ptychodera flava]|uniref:regulator of microtubule dynamics protein 1-like n=1 Tax=Ptychodera flava TaxID=63121 RepID=UPI00396A6AC7